MGLDKIQLLEQLIRQLRKTGDIAEEAEANAREAAATLATESEKKEDGRAMIEFGSLAKGQAVRAREAKDALKQIMDFNECGVPAFRATAPVQLGALVDVSVEDEDGETDERTFLVMPAGAGTELTGPGGDGYLSVITPASPVGRALLGKRAGQTTEVSIAGETRAWTILEVG